jgi:hypothetical protein
MQACIGREQQKHHENNAGKCSFGQGQYIESKTWRFG